MITIKKIKTTGRKPHGPALYGIYRGESHIGMLCKGENAWTPLPLKGTGELQLSEEEKMEVANFASRI